jgi:peptidoglycan-associated lipoprotein
MKTNMSLLLGLVAIFMMACETDEECDAEAGKKSVVEETSVGTAEDFKRSVKDRVYFHFSKSGLTSDAKRTLEGQSAWLKTHSAARATIEGHCDKRGTREYNLALGERRANSARDALVMNGVEENRLSTVSFGKDKLPIEGNSEHVHAQNRTAITVIQ